MKFSILSALAVFGCVTASNIDSVPSFLPITTDAAGMKTINITGTYEGVDEALGIVTKVGTSPQILTLTLGFGNLESYMISNVNCLTTSAAFPVAYQPSRSTMYKEISSSITQVIDPWFVNGTGIVNGTMSQDTFCFSTSNCTTQSFNQTFYNVATCNTGKLLTDNEGLLALAPGSSTNFVKALASKDIISKNQIGFEINSVSHSAMGKASTYDTSVTFGGPANANNGANFTFLNTFDGMSSKYWKFHLTDLKYHHTSILKGTGATDDIKIRFSPSIGLSLIPFPDFDYLTSFLPKNFTTHSTGYSYAKGACSAYYSQLEEIKIHFKEASIHLSPQAYMLNQTTSECIFAFVPINNTIRGTVNKEHTAYVIGAPLLANFAILFDQDTMKMGLGQSKNTALGTYIKIQNNPGDSSSSSGMSGWVIAIIVMAVVIVIAVVVALICRSKKAAPSEYNPISDAKRF